MSVVKRPREAVVQRLAEQLDRAWQLKRPIEPISKVGIRDVLVAYEIQRCWTNIRCMRGETVVGHKIGLTSQPIRQQFGVNKPDYGALWQSSFYEAKHGHVDIPISHFIQPRIEGEIAFLIDRRLQGPNVTPEEVLASTRGYAVGVEIVDSRIVDWNVRLVDTVADNASYGGFTLGPWNPAIHNVDLGSLVLNIQKNGELGAEGFASAVMGHPAKSVAWLVNELSTLGMSLESNDIIFSGGITRMLTIKAGDEFSFSLTGRPNLTLTFF